MSSVEIKFEARNLVHAAKMQQQFVNQMKPLGYEYSKIETQPLAGDRLQAKITLVYQSKRKKEKQ